MAIGNPTLVNIKKMIMGSTLWPAPVVQRCPVQFIPGPISTRIKAAFAFITAQPQVHITILHQAGNIHPAPAALTPGQGSIPHPL